MENWVEKVAVVTGAGEGIGAAIAQDLVRAGMTVVGLSRRKDKVEALRASLFGAPGKLNAFECDITNEESIRAAYVWIEKTLGGVDLVVNNAGLISKYLFLEDNSTKDLKQLLDFTICGLCMVTREAVKTMKKREVDGHIININSIFGHKVNTCVPGTRPINGLYPASKFAVTAITECMRQELLFMETGIKITSISPGLVEGDIIATGSGNDLIKLMPRLKPEDVSRAVLFAIQQPDHVQIHDIILKPMGEFL